MDDYCEFCGALLDEDDFCSDTSCPMSFDAAEEYFPWEDEFDTEDDEIDRYSDF